MTGTLTPPSPTSSLPLELRGKQEPRICLVPPGAVDFESGETALDLAHIAGRYMLPWQAMGVRLGKARAADGRWAAFEVGMLVSRQNGKNGGIEVVELSWMVEEPGVSILHTAHEFQTALESMQRLEDLIRSHPKLEKEIAQVRHGNGKEMIRLRNGSTIRFRTRTKSGGRGFSVDRLVIDEAMIWSPASQAAIMPLLTTAENPQIWYLGSAADANVHEYCAKWSGLRAAGVKGEARRLLWLEWSAPDPPEDPDARAAWRLDPDNIAAANPSLEWALPTRGPLVTFDYIDAEVESFRANLEKWEVERLGAGVWPPEEDEYDRVVPAEVVGDRVDRSPRFVGSPVLGIDLAPDRRRWAVSAGWRTEAGRVHLEVGMWKACTHAELVRFVEAVVTDWDPVAVVLDGRSLAPVIVPKLVAIGIEPELLNTPQMAAASGGIVDDMLAGTVSHSGQPDFINAVDAARKRELPQGDFVFDRDGGGAVPLIAAACAYEGVLLFASAPKDTPASPATGAPAERSGHGSELDVLGAAF